MPFAAASSTVAAGVETSQTHRARVDVEVEVEVEDGARPSRTDMGFSFHTEGAVVGSQRVSPLSAPCACW